MNWIGPWEIVCERCGLRDARRFRKLAEAIAAAKSIEVCARCGHREEGASEQGGAR